MYNKYKITDEHNVRPLTTEYSSFIEGIVLLIMIVAISIFIVKLLKTDKKLVDRKTL